MKRFPYKLVTFDVNGTLLNVAPIGKTYAHIAQKHGLFVDPHSVSKAFRCAYKTMDQNHPNFGVTSMGWQAWWTAVVKDTIVSATGDSKSARAKLDPIAIELIEHFATGTPWILQDGATGILDTLASHATLGIISNTDPRLHGVLRDHQLAKYFDFVLTSYETGTPKPSIDMFNLASQLYEKISGNNLSEGDGLHIGNSYDLDCAAACKAGWHSVLVHSKDQIDSKNCIVCTNLRELEHHLVKIMT